MPERCGKCGSPMVCLRLVVALILGAALGATLVIVFIGGR